MKRWYSYLLFLVTFFLLIIFWVLNLRVRFENETTNIVMELGRLFGLLGVYSILVQIVLVGCIRWIEQAFGFDHLTRIHRWNGMAVAVFILFHPVFLSIGYALRDDNSVFGQFIKFFGWDGVPMAFAASLIFAAVIITSIVKVRKHLSYEWWYAIHLLTYAALLLAFRHQVMVGTDFIDSVLFRWYWYFLYVFAIGSLVYYRIVKPLFYFWWHGFFVEKVVRETDDVVSIYIGGRKMDRFSAVAGQFVILRFLSKGMWWQEHPFSLSNIPNGKYLRVTIKNVGDFTAQVPAVQPGTRVIIDGPYGIFTADRCTKAKVLMIAGGIGVTPLRSVGEQLVASGKQVTLIYSNRKLSGAALRNELEAIAKTTPSFKIYDIITDDPSWKGRRGRLTKELLQELAPDLSERDVYLCGPPPMMKAIIGTLHDLHLPQQQIHHELFSL